MAGFRYWEGKRGESRDSTCDAKGTETRAKLYQTCGIHPSSRHAGDRQEDCKFKGNTNYMTSSWPAWHTKMLSKGTNTQIEALAQ